MRQYNKQIAEGIKDFLDKESFFYRFNEEEGRFDFGMTLTNRVRNVDFRIYAANTHFALYLMSPIAPFAKDADMMSNVAMYLTRINYRICEGCFDLDLSDGEVRVKVFVDCEGLERPSFAMVENALAVAFGAYRKYADGLVWVMYLGMDPKEAFEKAESGYSQSHTYLRPAESEEELEETEETEETPPLDSERLQLLRRMMSDFIETKSDEDDEDDEDDDEEELIFDDEDEEDGDEDDTDSEE